MPKKFIDETPVVGPSLISKIKSTLFWGWRITLGSIFAENLPDLLYNSSSLWTSAWTFERVYTDLGLSSTSSSNLSVLRALFPSKSTLLIIGFSTTKTIRPEFSYLIATSANKPVLNKIFRDWSTTSS